jgi:hypothetical protein
MDIRSKLGFLQNEKMPVKAFPMQKESHLQRRQACKGYTKEDISRKPGIFMNLGRFRARPYWLHFVWLRVTKGLNKS